MRIAEVTRKPTAKQIAELMGRNRNRVAHYMKPVPKPARGRPLELPEGCANREESYCHGGDSKQARIRQKKVSPFPRYILAFVAFLATSIRCGFALLRSPLGGHSGLETSREYGALRSQKRRDRHLSAD